MGCVGVHSAPTQPIFGVFPRPLRGGGGVKNGRRASLSRNGILKYMTAILIDSHEDLAYNMLTFGRDYRRAAAETRQREAGTQAPLHNGDTLLGWPDYQRGRVAVIFATLFAAPPAARWASGIS